MTESNIDSMENIFKEPVKGGEEKKTAKEEIDEKPKNDENELVITNESDDWSPRRLNNIQMKIINYVLNNSSLFIPYLLPNDKIVGPNELKKINQFDLLNIYTSQLNKSSFVFGFNELNQCFHRLFNKGNYKIAEKKHFIDLGQVVNNLLDEGKQLNVINLSRA